MAKDIHPIRSQIEMNLKNIIETLGLIILTEPKTDLDQFTPIGGYTSDLLSCVMAGANPQNIWVTLQAHINIVAVASLKEVAAVIITENAQPEADTIKKANDEGVLLLSTPKTSFEVVGKLWELGLREK